MRYIVEYTAPNNFTVNVVVQNTSKRDVKSKTNSILGLLQNKNTQNYVNVINNIHMINERTPVKVEEWELDTERYTYSASREYAVYVVVNNIPSLFRVFGNGIKTAYMNLCNENMKDGTERII